MTIKTIKTKKSNILTHKVIEKQQKDVQLNFSQEPVTAFVNAINELYMNPNSKKAFKAFRDLFACEINVTIYQKENPNKEGLFWTLVGDVNRATLMDLFKAFLVGRVFTYEPFGTGPPYTTIVFIPNPLIFERIIFGIKLTTNSKNKITSITLAQHPPFP